MDLSAKQAGNYGRRCISLRNPHPTGGRLTSCQPFPIWLRN